MYLQGTGVGLNLVYSYKTKSSTLKLCTSYYDIAQSRSFTFTLYCTFIKFEIIRHWPSSSSCTLTTVVFVRSEDDWISLYCCCKINRYMYCFLHLKVQSLCYYRAWFSAKNEACLMWRFQTNAIEIQQLKTLMFDA